MHRELAIHHLDVVAWGERLDPLEIRPGRSGAEEREQVVDSLDVGADRDHSRRQDRLDLRTPKEPAVALGVVQRADPDAIPAQDEGPGLPVPERDGELAAGMGEHPLAVVFVEVDPGFGVAPGLEGVAAGQEFLADLGVLEEFAVERDPDRAVLVADRLSTPGEVDDRQATGAEDDAGFGVKLLVVGASVRDGAGHGQEPGDGKLATTRSIKRPGDSAHDSIPLEKRAIAGDRLGSARRESGRGRRAAQAAPAVRPAIDHRPEEADQRGPDPEQSSAGTDGNVERHVRGPPGG